MLLEDQLLRHLFPDWSDREAFDTDGDLDALERLDLLDDLCQPPLCLAASRQFHCDAPVSFVGRMRAPHDRLRDLFCAMADASRGFAAMAAGCVLRRFTRSAWLETMMA